MRRNDPSVVALQSTELRRLDRSASFYPLNPANDSSRRLLTFHLVVANLS